MAKFYGTAAGYTRDGRRTTEASRQGTMSVEVAARSWKGSVSIELYYKDNEEKKENLMIRAWYQWDASTAHPDNLIFDGKLSYFIDVLSNYTGDQG